MFREFVARLLLVVSPMHEVAFALKRAHWRCHRFLRILTARHGLTPARFDVLLAAHRLKGSAYQARIARMLGVARSTVCKMMRSMEALGLLVRLDRNVFDRRYRRWRLTERGKECYAKVLKMVQDGTVARILYQWIWIRERSDAVSAEGVLDDATTYARRMSRAWGDRATLYGAS